MMKLAIRKEEGSIPLSGFHYMVHPVRLSEGEAQLFDLIGYIVVEVEDDLGVRLLNEAGAALRHQVEVALLTEKKLANKG